MWALWWCQKMLHNQDKLENTQVCDHHISSFMSSYWCFLKKTCDQALQQSKNKSWVLQTLQTPLWSFKELWLGRWLHLRFFLFTSLTTNLCAYDVFYSLAVEYVGLFHAPCALLHHLSDLFDHFWRNGLTFGHEPQDNLPLFEDNSAAQQ